MDISDVTVTSEMSTGMNSWEASMLELLESSHRPTRLHGRPSDRQRQGTLEINSGTTLMRVNHVDGASASG